MTAAATYIQTTIAGNATIATLLTQGLFWELAPEDVLYPFADFSINQAPGRTKDEGYGYTVDLRVFGENITASAFIADTIMLEMKTIKPTWKFINATSGYTDTDAKVGFVQITYQFNL